MACLKADSKHGAGLPGQAVPVRCVTSGVNQAAGLEGAEVLVEGHAADRQRPAHDLDGLMDHHLAYALALALGLEGADVRCRTEE